ncbi:hypothetical protein GAY33_12000 [Azospirillum brasilense]|uniref:hypothetical protein n=1 Tax=Azospirillum argentinense TaxID=2970906 RepID=UPI00190C7D7C|nr:hypothetical protein [Azospirillum argentinense]MBK3799947.1 hypothetical protein [Azospirillum argentinense]
MAKSLLPGRGDAQGARFALSPVAWIGDRIGDGLWLGARIWNALWRLMQTHPTPQARKRRIERLLKAQV